jgi:hypothetical protein
MAIPEWLKEAARRRTVLHAGKPSQRLGGKDHEVVGIAGEYRFAQLFEGLVVDTAVKPSGDAGIDFVAAFDVVGAPTEFKIDVKTARKPHYLLVKPGDLRADIYVLAAYDDEREEASIVGWAWRAHVRMAPVKVLGDCPPSHAVPKEHLRPIGELLERYAPPLTEETA